jgi:methyltransferase family protein
MLALLGSTEMSEAADDANDTEALHYLWTPDLDPLFWREGRIDVVSAWYRHVPFAHWVVGASKPRTLVELGTFTGVSYSAFCEAVMRNVLEARCFAVDTWQGDEHTGRYGEEVYTDLRRFHDERYSAFSELLRCTFDEAVLHFADSSVDLLHIDGLHTYAAVRHDFDAWRPKLSDSAVVLLHDTNVRERDFGVWRLFEELSAQFPSFEFLHGHGLGLLAVGPSIPSEVLELCSLRSPAKVHAIRQRFALLGERWWALGQRDLEHKAEVATREARISALESDLAFLRERLASLEAEAARRADAEEQLRARAASRTEQARLDAAKAMARAANAVS